MPGLKRVLSAFGMSKEAKEQDSSPFRRQSLLTRSGTVLKKKKKTKPFSAQDQVSSDDERFDANGRPNELLADERHLRDELSDSLSNNRPWPDEFEAEMQAMARIRSERRILHVPLQQTQQEYAFNERFFPFHRRDIPRSRARHTDSIKDRGKEEDGKSLRYPIPLPAIHEGSVQPVGRYSSSVTLLQPREPNRNDFSSLRQLDGQPNDLKKSVRRSSLIPPAVDPRDLLGFGLSPNRERREAWVHRQHRSEQVERVSHYFEHLRDPPEPVSSPTNQDSVAGASNLQNDKPVERSHAKGKGERSSSVRFANEIESSAKEWPSAQKRLSAQNRLSRRLSTAEEYADTPEHPEMPEDLETWPAIHYINDQLVQAAEANRPFVEQEALSWQFPHPRPPKIRDCIVCGDSKTLADFPAKPPSAACEHMPQTCSDCLSSWISSEVDTKGTEGIKCPECPQTLAYNDIQRAAPPATFAKYDNLATRAALGALTDFAWCLSPFCGSGQENHANANYMDCAACGYKQCLSHRMAWHDDETCAEYDYRTSGRKRRDEQAKTERMLDSVSKKCPNPKGCGWRIEQDGGCDHMTCRICRFEFCWQCSASQKAIRRVGNTGHAVGCKHHSRNLEVTWPFNMH